MIDALNPAGDSAIQMIVRDALLTNCPESYPMWQAEIHEIVSIQMSNDTHLQPRGRELVKRFTSQIVMKPDASSSIASKMGCSRMISMYFIVHASGF